MKKNLTELVFILDRSGSMAGLEKDTIGGFNSMIARQKAAEGEALVSTVLFSNESKVIHDRIDVRRVEPLDRKAVCRVRLHDAAGRHRRRDSPHRQRPQVGP